jgi:hypothetical protein
MRRTIAEALAGLRADLHVASGSPEQETRWSRFESLAGRFLEVTGEGCYFVCFDLPFPHFVVFLTPQNLPEKKTHTKSSNDETGNSRSR